MKVKGAYQKLWDAAKTALQGKLIALKFSITKELAFDITELSLRSYKKIRLNSVNRKK